MKLRKRAAGEFLRLYLKEYVIKVENKWRREEE